MGLHVIRAGTFDSTSERHAVPRDHSLHGMLLSFYGWALLVISADLLWPCLVSLTFPSTCTVPAADVRQRHRVYTYTVISVSAPYLVAQERSFPANLLV